MPWARLDDGFHDHPKVDGLSLAAVGLYTLCLTWAHRHRRTAIVPGHITDARVRKIAGTKAHALVTELVGSGLWENEPHIGGWVIHDFEDYLPKQRDPDELREAGSRGGKAKANSQAEAKQTASNLPPGDVAKASSRASAPASPSRPVPKELSTSLSGERNETLRVVPASEHPPTTPDKARCTAHVGVADPGPCNGCRKERERLEREVEKADREARLDRERRARDCRACDGVHVLDDEGNITRRKCDHRRTA